MYLYVSYPERTAYFHLGVEEVGSRIRIVQAGIDYFYASPVGRDERSERKEALLPGKVE
jgi:hypothetical protein